MPPCTDSSVCWQRPLFGLPLDVYKRQLIIGSGNLTEGGLFSNYEINLQVELDLNNEEDKTLFLDIQNVLDEWSSHQDGLCLKLDEGLLAQLEDEGLIMSEAIARADRDRAPSSVATSFSDANQTLFSWTPVNPCLLYTS